MQHPVRDREERAAQAQLSGGFLAAHAREGAQVGEADFHAGLLHRALGQTATGAMGMDDGIACRAEEADPVVDEAAFAGLGAFQLLRQRRAAATAHAVAEHYDLADFEHLDRKFERCGNTVVAG